MKTSLYNVKITYRTADERERRFVVSSKLADMINRAENSVKPRI